MVHCQILISQLSPIQVGRPRESAEMYRKMLSQPDDVLNSSFAMRMRIAGLRVSMSKLLRARFDSSKNKKTLQSED